MHIPSIQTYLLVSILVTSISIDLAVALIRRKLFNEELFNDIMLEQPTLRTSVKNIIGASLGCCRVNILFGMYGLFSFTLLWSIYWHCFLGLFSLYNLAILYKILKNLEADKSLISNFILFGKSKIFYLLCTLVITIVFVEIVLLIAINSGYLKVKIT